MPQKVVILGNQMNQGPRVESRSPNLLQPSIKTKNAGREFSLKVAGESGRKPNKLGVREAWHDSSPEALTVRLQVHQRFHKSSQIYLQQTHYAYSSKQIGAENKIESVQTREKTRLKRRDKRLGESPELHKKEEEAMLSTRERRKHPSWRYRAKGSSAHALI